MEDYTKINKMEEMRRTIKTIHKQADELMATTTVACPTQCHAGNGKYLQADECIGCNGHKQITVFL